MWGQAAVSAHPDCAGNPDAVAFRNVGADPKTVHFVFECAQPFSAFFFAFLASDRLGLRVS